MERNGIKTENSNKIRELASKIGKIGNCILTHRTLILPKSCTCDICGAKISNYTYHKHFKKFHNISKEEYFAQHPEHTGIQPKNYVHVNNKIIPKGQIRKKNYGELSLTQVKFLLHVKSYHVGTGGIRLPVLEDLMFRRTHPELTSAYELFDKYKEIVRYLRDNFRKTNESLEYLTLRYGTTKATEMRQAKSQRVTGDKNPGYRHNGRMSAWSKNFKYGYDEERHKQFKKNLSDFVKKNRHLYEFMIEYWIEKCDGDVEKATELYKKSQTRDLSWFVNKYGETDGKKRHKAKTEKWMKSFKKSNFSKISQEVFDGIMTKGYSGDVYYATHDRPEMAGYINNEYILKTSDSYIRPDFIDLTKRKIIEFDGDYWHSPARANRLREAKRDESIKNAGYKVLHVKEHDYNKDKNRTVAKCLDFLQSS